MQPDANVPRHTIRTEGAATQRLVFIMVIFEMPSRSLLLALHCTELHGGTLPCALMGCVLIVVSPGCRKWPLFERCADCCSYHSRACDLRTSGMTA